MCPGEVVITSGDGYFFVDNSKEYAGVYKNPSDNRFKTQLAYLDALFRYLKQQNIPVVALELPLTNANHILLSDMFWNSYIQQVSDICKRNGVDWWDTGREDFSLSEFCDSAQLNLKGGLHLAKLIEIAIACKLRLPVYEYNGHTGNFLLTHPNSRSISVSSSSDLVAQ